MIGGPVDLGVFAVFVFTMVLLIMCAVLLVDHFAGLRKRR